MRKKILITSILIILILSSLIIPIIYAEGTGAISVPTKELKIGEQIKVYINLGNITEYTVSKVVLETDIYIEPSIDTANTSITNENAVFNNKVYTITIPEGEASPVCVLYTIPNYMAGDTKINIKGTILTKVDEVEEVKETSNFEITVIEDKVPEKPVEEENSNTGDNEKDDIKTPNGTNNTDKNNNVGEMPTGSNSNSSNNFSQSSSMGSMGIGSSTETATYEGSINNYLSNIKVNGYSLTPKFNKTNSTYFITVPNKVKSLTVTGVKEDSEAVVSVSRK